MGRRLLQERFRHNYSFPNFFVDRGYLVRYVKLIEICTQARPTFNHIIIFKNVSRVFNGEYNGAVFRISRYQSSALVLL